MRFIGLLFLFLCLMADRPASADTTVRLKGPKNIENPVRSRVGPLTANDTLWRIAEDVRPHPGLNMYQVMYAIYLKNPDAFLDDNFNHLNYGSFLTIPSIDEILAVDGIEAQQKSEDDDRRWAEQIRAAAAAKQKEGLVTARQQDVVKAREEIKTELGRVEGLQKQQLVELQRRLAESNATVESVLTDNNALKEKLDTLTDQLLKVQSQVDKDSEIQKQLQMLVQQQTEMLEQQRAQIAREQEGFNFARWWQNMSDSGLSWVLLGTLPVIALLVLVLGWLKRRTQHTEHVVTAATAAPTQDPHYKSPLPPLDDSLDFDESSLMTLDESLLGGSAKSGVRLDSDTLDLSDELLNTGKGSSFNDILLDDDELLDTKDLLNSSNLDDELLDDLLDEPAPAVELESKEFDPDNILSGTDLSSLLEEDVLDESADDIFAQAVAEQLASEEKQKLASSQTNAGDVDPLNDDDLIEEIELDDPEPEPVLIAEELPEEVEEVDFDSLLEELQSEPPLVIDDLATEPEVVLADELELAEGIQADELLAESTQFDSSELDEFAESLVDEELPSEWPSLTEQTDTELASSDEPHAESVESSEALKELVTEAMVGSEPLTIQDLDQAEIVEPVAETTGDVLQFEDDDYPLTPDDVALLLSDDDTLTSEMPVHFHADHAELVSESDDLSSESLPTDNLLSDEQAQSWQELSETLADEIAVAPVPELDGVEDLSVSRVSEAALSVEKPSQVLEQYPELELGDDFFEEQDEELQTESDFLPDEYENLPQSDELEELEGLDFDQLLADVSEPEQHETESSDADTAAQVLAELNETEEPIAEPLSGGMDDVDTALLELDALLEDSDETQIAVAPEQLTVDVGLEDYKEFIAQQQDSELDPLEQIYGADLDLIRAYLEIGEQEGAELLIDKLLAADGLPEGIRSEVLKLQQQLE